MGQVAVTETGDSVPVRPTVPQQLGQGENLNNKHRFIDDRKQ